MTKRKSYKKPKESKLKTIGKYIGKSAGTIGRSFKEGAKSTYNVATSPRTERFFSGSREAIASELNEQQPISEYDIRRLELEDLKREQERAELDRIKTEIMRLKSKKLKRLPTTQQRMTRDPFSQVQSDFQPSKDLKLGWGGF